MFTDPAFSGLEIVGLISVLAVAVLGLGYAWMLSRQILAADTGTPRMQAVAAAVRGLKP